MADSLPNDELGQKATTGRRGREADKTAKPESTYRQNQPTDDESNPDLPVVPSPPCSNRTPQYDGSQIGPSPPLAPVRPAQTRAAQQLTVQSLQDARHFGSQKPVSCISLDPRWVCQIKERREQSHQGGGDARILCMVGERREATCHNRMAQAKVSQLAMKHSQRCQKHPSLWHAEAIYLFRLLWPHPRPCPPLVAVCLVSRTQLVDAPALRVSALVCRPENVVRFCSRPIRDAGPPCAPGFLLLKLNRNPIQPPKGRAVKSERKSQ
jgi:hypothetical protein